MMRKEISKVDTEEKSIYFKKAVLYIGWSNGITYILTLLNPEKIASFSNGKINIVTAEGKRKTIEGNLDYVSNSEARFYISGEPFPVTEQEIRKFS